VDENPAADKRETHRRERVDLTPAELRVLAAVEDLRYEQGYAPTLAQIAARIGWKSTGSVHEYLDRLRARGLVEGRGRSLRVVG
jgi:SOS-response transcriptional repressor LexA